MYKKNLLPLREPYGSCTYNIVSGAYNMQIWEAETLHMSQLAGGWDFLTLSDGRCAPKNNNKWYYKQSCSCGEAACCCWTAGHRLTKGQKELLKPPQKLQEWCWGTASLPYPLLILAAGVSARRAARAQQNVIFLGNELPEWQVAEVAGGCTSPAVTAACLDLTPFPELQIITAPYRAHSIALTHI